MRLLVSLLAVVALGLASVQETSAQDQYWYDQDPLPKGMTAEEELRRHEIGLHRQASPPPAGPVRNIAEVDRNEAAMIRYPLGIPLALVSALADQVTVITLVSSQTQQNQATTAFQNAGVNMDNVQFLQAPTNSVWVRDYGPFYVADENHQVSIVDFAYNRPRPLDNAIPAALAAYLDIPAYGMDLVHTGGNYMTDGLGIGASTDLIWEENNNDQSLVLAQMADYMGITEYHVTIDPQGDYIKHIDTWGKFLDVDKVLMSRVPATHPRYEEYEEVAAYFAEQISAYGTTYQVYRVDTPQGQPYANSLILNERVYVPIMGSPWDAAALQAYEEAMPGYEVIGIASPPHPNAWASTDALHCRVKEIADRGMLHLAHVPISGEQPYEPAIELEVDIIPYSGEPLIADSLFLIYRADTAPFDTLALSHVDGHTFSAALPVGKEGVEIAYYFSAADESGRRETFPLIGPEGARTFTVEPSVSTEPPVAEAGIALESPYPNPSVGAATLRYHLASGGPVSVVVYDVLGREVVRIIDGVQPSGWHVVELPPDLSAGSYVVQLSAASQRLARRFTRIN